jgi:chromosome segregation ATPase
MAILYHIQTQNDKQRKQLDEIFIQRKNKETDIAQIEEQIHDINMSFEERLNELDPDLRSQYERLREENGQLEQEIMKRRSDLDEVSMKLSIAESKLREDPRKERAQQLRDEKNKLQNKKDDLQLQTDEMNLPFPEARGRLIAKAKEDQAKLKELEQRIQEVRKLSESYQKQMKEIDGELKENKADIVDKNKFEILMERDKEYTEFINNFDIMKNNELEEVSKLEKNIMLLLETMSKNVIKMKTVPSQEETKSGQADVDHKKKILEQDALTYERLQNEVEERQLQLERMRNVEESIEKNIKIFKDKVEMMQNELNTKYANVDDLAVKAETDKKRLTLLRGYYSTHKDALKEQVTLSSMKADAKKIQLSENDAYKGLVELEKKVAENEGSLFSIKQFIEGKKYEANYAKTLADCMSLISSINNENIKAVSGTH